jgi:plastocyanin
VAAIVAIALAMSAPARAGAAQRGVPPTSDPGAAQLCMSQPTLSSSPQSVDGVRVVAVCVDNYQYVPGDDNVLPCVGYVAGGPVGDCVSAGRAAAPRLEIPRGTQLLFVVPDPNMHTLTSVGCPNAYADPPSPDPLGAFNLVIGTIEEGLFGPDEVSTHGRCLFDSYETNGGTAHDKPGAGALMGPGYESVDTSRLPRGTYHFYCQVHAFMRGTLVVS